MAKKKVAEVKDVKEEAIEKKEAQAPQQADTPDVVIVAPSEALPSETDTGAMDEEEYLRKTSKAKAASFNELGWNPKTEMGRKVKSGELTDINEIVDNGEKIKESEVVDILVPEIESDFLMVGQSKGKFGGGKRKIFRQTQKKTREGNKPHFEIMAIVGNKNGFVGLGYGKSKETVPAREKSVRNAKLNIVKIKRGCGSWQCGCREPHTIPYEIVGKCGSVTVKLRPAPKGTGLKIEKECAKILRLAGIKDVWSEARGKTTTKVNLVQACFDALKKLSSIKTQERFVPELGIVEGRL